MYPRITKGGRLVSDEHLVGYREHLGGKHRILFLTGFMGAKCPHCFGGEEDLQNFLIALDTLSHDPITLVISSPGGYLDYAFSLYDTLRTIQSPVVTLGRYCASASVLIFAAGRKRYLFPHARLMLHMAVGQSEGDIKDQKIQLRQMEQSQNRIIDVLLECGARKSREEIFSDIDRDFWLDPAEAIAYGLADEILTPETMEELLKCQNT